MQNILNNVKQILTPDEDRAIALLVDEFRSDDWDLNYIEKQKFRCSDDAKKAVIYSNGDPVLNIGGAPYVFELLYKSMVNSRVETIDLNPSRHKKQIKNLELCVHSCNIELIENYNFIQIEKFRLILLNEILEHLRFDIINTLTLIRDSMHSDCLLMVTTPNFYYRPTFMNMINQQRSGPAPLGQWSKINAIGHMGHVREYSRIEVVELFQYLNFEIIYEEFRNSRRKIFPGGPDLSKPLHKWHYEAESNAAVAQEMVFVFKKMK